MLDAYFYGGAVTGGAMLGLGLMARALPEGADTAPHVRSVSVLLAAFATGLGITACVVGLLAAFEGGAASADGQQAALFTLVPAALLGIPGLVIGRPGQRTGVERTATLLLAFAAAVGGMAVVAAVFALLLLEGGGANEIGLAGLLLGVIGAGAAIALGLIGASGVRTVAQAGPDITAAEAQAVRGPIVIRAAVAEGIGILTVVSAMMLALGIFD